jgi:hypothetical protein
LFEGRLIKRFYRVIDVDEDLFEEKRKETLAGFILEIR